MTGGYRFGAFVLDVKRRVVTRDGTPVPVTPKAFDILLYLVQHPNRVVTKQDLMKAVWPDTFVEETNLAQNLWLLRKALGEKDGNPLIVTVARQGYHFTADVTEIDPSAPVVESEAPAQVSTAGAPARRRWTGIAIVAAVLVVAGGA